MVGKETDEASFWVVGDLPPQQSLEQDPQVPLNVRPSADSLLKPLSCVSRAQLRPPAGAAGGRSRTGGQSHRFSQKPREEAPQGFPPPRTVEAEAEGRRATSTRGALG